jgi:hypothetical protein
VWSVDLTTRIVGGDSAPAQRVHQLQQLAQAGQAELRINPRRLALARPVGVRPALRELHRRTIRKPDHNTGLAGRQDLELLPAKRMVATDNGYLGRDS